MIRRLAGPLVALVAFVGTFEAVVRVANPAPRVQAVTADRLLPTGPDGVLTWRDGPSDAREKGACAPDERGVLLVGSSILYGSGLGPDDVVSAFLGPLLEGTSAAGCVRNVAQPAFAGEQKLAVAREAVAAHRPLLVVWEVWTSDHGRYARFGERAYNVGELPLDRLGTPVAFPVPAAAHAWLFRHSRAWRYLHLSLAGHDEAAYRASWDRVLREQLPEARRLVEAAGGRLLLVVLPPLDQPFAVSEAEHHARDGLFGPLLAGEGGYDVIDAAALLRDHDPADIRLDPCCHYTAEGHRVLAEVLAPEIARRLPPPPG